MIKIRCPWCRRQIRPTKTGRIWTHKPNTRENSGEYLGNCAGSGRSIGEWNDLRPLRVTLPEPFLAPGGGAACAAGCTCSLIDNNHGRWAPCHPAGWFVALDCPLHRKKTSR